MSLGEQLRTDMANAMRSGDHARRDTLRLLLAAVGNARIEAGHDLSDDEVRGVLQRQSKQRRDSIAEYGRAGRDDLVAAEQGELEVIASYLPAQLTDDEVRAVAEEVVREVGATGAGDLGKVMRPLLERLGSRADGRRANAIAREVLGG